MFELLSEINKSYVTILCNMVAPFVFEGFQKMYNDIAFPTSLPNNIELRMEDILYMFLNCLKLCKSWDKTIINEHTIIEHEVMRIMLALQQNAAYIHDLLKAILKTYLVIHMYNPSLNSQISIDKSYYENIDINHFFHLVYIEVAKELWSNPFLLYHKFSLFEIKRNQRDLLNIIKNNIKDSILKLLPLKHILANYLRNEHENIQCPMQTSIYSNVQPSIPHNIQPSPQSNIQSFLNLPSHEEVHPSVQSFINSPSQEGVGRSIKEYINQITSLSENYNTQYNQIKPANNTATNTATNTANNTANNTVTKTAINTANNTANNTATNTERLEQIKKIIDDDKESLNFSNINAITNKTKTPVIDTKINNILEKYNNKTNNKNNNNNNNNKNNNNESNDETSIIDTKMNEFHEIFSN